MPRGLVLNIQRYCIHDGPGIRTTVFLKGCPLSCWWCHNPESQSSEVQLSVAQSRCVRCGTCLEACPQPSAKVADTTRNPHCERCGACVAACPTGARQLLGQWRDASWVLDEVLRDRLFFDESGGGVTVSGGEPLMQPGFVRALLAGCREAGIHTALDTCGFAPRDALLESAPLVDVFLYDLKSMDDQRHSLHTGVSNTSILQNLMAVATIHGNIWVRVPLIPGFNDSRQQMEAMAGFVASVRAVRQVNLLPYHELGTHKAGPPEVAPGAATPATVGTVSAAQLAAAAEPFRAAGIPTFVGG